MGKQPNPYIKVIDLVKVIVGFDCCELEYLIESRLKSTRLGIIEKIRKYTPLGKISSPHVNKEKGVVPVG